MALTGLARFRNAVQPTAGWTSGGLWFGWSMALVSTVSFSIAPTITRGAITGGMNPTTLLAARLLISMLLLGGTLVSIAPGRLPMDRAGLLASSAAGLANGLGMLAFFWALARVEASIVSMIFSLSPLVALGLLTLRGERLTRRHILRLLLGLAGVYLLIGPVGTNRVDWVGLSLILVATFNFAVHLVLIQWYLQGYDARTVTFYVVAAMTVVTVGWWLFRGAEWHDPGWSGWLAIGALVVISTYLARLTLFVGVRHLGSRQIALLMPLETLLAVIWSVLFLSERLTVGQWLGGLLILASALLAVKRLNRTRWRPRWRVWPWL